jgi:hypothetical protein
MWSVGVTLLELAGRLVPEWHRIFIPRITWCLIGAPITRIDGRLVRAFRRARRCIMIRTTQKRWWTEASDSEKDITVVDVGGA